MELTQTSLIWKHSHSMGISPYENRMIFRAYHFETQYCGLYSFSFSFELKLFCKEYGNRKPNNSKQNPRHGHMHTFQRNDTFDTMQNKTQQNKSFNQSFSKVYRKIHYLCVFKHYLGHSFLC